MSAYPIRSASKQLPHKFIASTEAVAQPIDDLAVVVDGRSISIEADRLRRHRTLAAKGRRVWRVPRAEILQKARLPVSSLSFAGGFTGGCGFSYVEAIADARQAINQARILGAKNVIMVSGSQNGHTVRHSRRMVVDALKELGDSRGRRSD